MLRYFSSRTVEELQAFTAQSVPVPRWVKVEGVEIRETIIESAADTLIAQLGHRGIDKIGGREWWKWRRDGATLKAEWIEMKTDYKARKREGGKSQRVIFYVHGGAYYFGSVDEHRYQLQRHARKLKARLFAPRYRLAPQFPFPCGLLDCLAAYKYLLTLQGPSTIIMAGDSAGGGMVLSILVILRDQGIPLPAGAILISPWVDLTHSFPSVAGDNALDYIPAHGFVHRPSPSWPPPNEDDKQQINLHAIEELAKGDLPRKCTQRERKTAAEDAVQGFSTDYSPHDLDTLAENEDAEFGPGNTMPGPGRDLSITIDGKLITIKDQIQLYTTNQLISHPLVSPVLQPSLGGLPPLLILTGGGEILRDEQIYLAHKAADPSSYPPGESYLKEYPQANNIITKWKPTYVQLQVWDDLCHVAPTLSFTRPAKHMYCSIAQFGAWALARAQKTNLEIMDDDDISIISTDTDSGTEPPQSHRKSGQESHAIASGVVKTGTTSSQRIGRAGDDLTPFHNHMIRQRVDRHGSIFPLGPPTSLPALQVHPNEIGVIKPGPVQKWMNVKEEWDRRYAKEKRKTQNRQAKERAQGYQEFPTNDAPPPSALAGRRGLTMPNERKKHLRLGLRVWSLWGSSHDTKTVSISQPMCMTCKMHPQ